MKKSMLFILLCCAVGRADDIQLLFSAYLDNSEESAYLELSCDDLGVSIDPSCMAMAMPASNPASPAVAPAVTAPMAGPAISPVSPTIGPAAFPGMMYP